MSQLLINIGTAPAAGDGESVRAGFAKTNTMFTEAYAHIANQSNPHGVTAAQIGAVATSALGAANGVATLDANQKLVASQLPATGVTAGTYGGLVVNSSGVITSTAATASFTAPVVMASSLLLTQAIETATNPAITSGALTIDLTAGSLFYVDHTTNVTTLTIANPPAVNQVCMFVLVLKSEGNGALVTWPSSILWPNGTAPTLTIASGKKDVFSFFSYDGGATYHGVTIGQSF